MAEQKRTSKCVAIRSGRNTKFIGLVQNTQLTMRLKQLDKRPEPNHLEQSMENQTATILHLDDLPLQNIFKYLRSDDFAALWCTGRHFKTVAADAFNSIWRNGEETAIRIDLSSSTAPDKQSEDNYHMMKKFGNYTSRIKLIGNNDEIVNGVDALVMFDIIRYCPIATKVTLQHVDYNLTFAFLQQRNATTVDFLFTSMPREVLMVSNLAEFSGNISPSAKCDLCVSFNGNISHKQFEEFFAINRQLKKVTLYAINSDICENDCNISKDDFFWMVRRVVSRNRIQLDSFIIYAANKRRHTLRRAGLFDTTIKE